MMFDVFSAQSVKTMKGSWSHTTSEGGKMRFIDAVMYHDNRKRTCAQVRTDLIAEGFPTDIIVKKAK